MIQISRRVVLSETEIDITAVRSSGAGGQNVNKVASAAHLRFDIRRSSLPDYYKKRLFSFQDHRITSAGIIVIKAQRFRDFHKNRKDACERLRLLILRATSQKAKRIATKPTKRSQEKRLSAKKNRSWKKSMRSQVTDSSS